MSHEIDDIELVKVASAAAGKAWRKPWVRMNLDAFEDACSIAMIAGVQALRSWRADKKMSQASWVFLKSYYSVITAAATPLRKLASQGQPWDPIPEQLPLDDPEVSLLLSEVEIEARAIGADKDLFVDGFGVTAKEQAAANKVSKAWQSRLSAKAMARLRKRLGVL